MKFLVALVTVVAIVGLTQATALRKDPLATNGDVWGPIKCEACKVLDQAILGFGEVGGQALKTYLDGECNKIADANGKFWCTSFVDDAVAFVEKFGSRLDEHELCTVLLKAC